MLKSEFTLVFIAVFLGLVAGVSRYWGGISYFELNVELDQDVKPLVGNGFWL